MDEETRREFDEIWQRMENHHKRIGGDPLTGLKGLEHDVGTLMTWKEIEERRRAARVEKSGDRTWDVVVIVIAFILNNLLMWYLNKP